jgi:hypothetical protein
MALKARSPGDNYKYTCYESDGFYSPKNGMPSVKVLKVCLKRPMDNLSSLTIDPREVKSSKQV